MQTIAKVSPSISFGVDATIGSNVEDLLVEDLDSAENDGCVIGYASNRQQS